MALRSEQQLPAAARKQIDVALAMIGALDIELVTLDLELRPYGIRVNAVAPQLIDTASNRASLPADVIAHAEAPEAIAEVIAFLVSDAAAPVSGAILPAYGA